MEEIYTILESTIAVDGAVRRAAEAKIQEIQTQPEFVRILMSLASSNEVDDRASNLSRIAGVTLKNICKKNWDEAADIQLSPELEEEIRQSIVEALFRKGKGGSQLSDAIFHIAKKDFPEKWPNLVPSLANVLSTDSMEHIELALHTLDEIFKKFRYESKSTELWTELKRVLLTVQEPLTKFYAKLVQSTADIMKSSDQNMRRVWGDCTLAAVKIFHSLSSQDLPEYFEDNLKTWAEGFQVLIDGALTTELTNHAEQIKAEIFDICTLYAQRYEEEFGPFIQGCLNAAWKTLVETNDDTKNDQMICSALEFISSIAAKVQYAELFNDEVLEKITDNICIRALRLREVDIDLWEDDAVEYLTQDLQGSNIGTRRRGAVDLVRSLYRRFSDKLTVLLTRVLGQLVGSGDWKSIDVLYSLVNAICSRTETAKEGATSTNSFIDVCDFYRNQVRVHLNHPLNEFPMLKADALKFAVTFRGQLQPEMLVETVNFCGQLLLADKAILHKYSAYCIEKLLLMKTPDNAGPLLTAQCVDVAQLLQNLVAGFKKDPKAQHTPYLMKAILRVIAILDENTARHGGDIASELAQLVEASTKTPADPVHTHFLFESICLLVQKTAKLEGFSGLDEQLMPLVAVILSSDNQDLIPYALQVTGVLLSAAIVRGNISSHFTSFVPFLLSAELWKRTANVPAALSVLEVYLKHTPQLVLSEHASLVFQQYVRLIGNKSLDKYGFQLAGAVIPVLEKIQGIEDPVKLIWNHMFQRIQSSKTPLFVKQFVVYIARWAIVRGADQLVKALASIQTNIFSMVMDRVVLAAFRENLKNMTTATDKRTIVIGFAKVIAESPAQLGSQYGDLAHCLVELVESVSASDRHTMSPEEEQASMYNAEGEFTNPYCRLSYAPKAEFLAPEVSSYKAVLAQALLHTAPRQDSSYLNCLLTEDIHRLRQYF